MSPFSYNKKYVPLAQQLRKNMTDHEKKLWYQFLKKLPITVNRQKNIGNYIVDFYIHSASLVIELDGSQHGEDGHAQADAERDAVLRDMGICVLRYTNEDIDNCFTVICEDILNHIQGSENFSFDLS